MIQFSRRLTLLASYNYKFTMATSPEPATPSAKTMDDKVEEDHACVPCGAKFKFQSKLERHLATRKHKIFAGSITEDVEFSPEDAAGECSPTYSVCYKTVRACGLSSCTTVNDHTSAE